MAASDSARQLRPWHVLLLGAFVGAATTAGLALTTTELYIEWGSLAGLLIVVPAFAALGTLAVMIPLALLRRVRWILVPLAVVVAVPVADGLFALTLGTEFARRRAALHWQRAQERADAAALESTRALCEAVLAAPDIPPPPMPGPAAGDSAAAQRIAPHAMPGLRLSPFTPDSCRALLGESRRR